MGQVVTHLKLNLLLKVMDCDEDGNLLITLADGSEIKTEGHLELDTVTNNTLFLMKVLPH